MAFIVLTISSLIFYPLINFPCVSEEKQKQQKKIYCIVMGLLFIFFIGLRSKNIGIDSLSYSNSFYKANPLNWEVFVGHIQKKECLYHILESLVRIFTPSYTVWFVIIAIAYVIPLCVFIYKKSDIPFISFILFMSMAYMNFAMAGMRQTFAASFLFLAFNCFCDKKYFKFIFWVLIATCFHITALIFISALIVPRSKIRKADVILFIICFVVLVLFGRQMIDIALSIVFKESRGYYTSEYGGISTFLLFLAIAVAALIFDKSLTNKDIEPDDKNAYFNFRFLLIAMLFQWLAIYQANCFRIAMYFSIFPVLTIIPNVLHRQKDPIVKGAGIVIVLVLLMFQLFGITYFISGINPYEFFWEI